MQSIAEVWKDIQGYEGLYQVSNLGRVKSLGRFIDNLVRGHYWQEERILKPRKTKRGYLIVTLSKNNKLKYFTVHRLVAITFISNTKNKPQIDHINADKTDNSVNNLRWVTAKENVNNPLTIASLSIAKKGKNNPMFGKTGKNSPIFGKKHSEETKRKISARLSGKNHPQAQKVRNIETKEIFDTIRDAEKKYNLSRSCIAYAIKHNGKSAGYHWEYVNASITQGD